MEDIFALSSSPPNTHAQIFLPLPHHKSKFQSQSVLASLHISSSQAHGRSQPTLPSFPPLSPSLPPPFSFLSSSPPPFSPFKAHPSNTAYNTLPPPSFFSTLILQSIHSSPQPPGEHTAYQRFFSTIKHYSYGSLRVCLVSILLSSAPYLVTSLGLRLLCAALVGLKFHQILVLGTVPIPFHWLLLRAMVMAIPYLNCSISLVSPKFIIFTIAIANIHYDYATGRIRQAKLLSQAPSMSGGGALNYKETTKMEIFRFPSIWGTLRKYYTR